LKSHGISPGAVSGVKREAKDADDNKKIKRPRVNKRKLEEVNEDEGDIDDLVKSELKVKGEVKHEDAKVKIEHANDIAQTTSIIPPSLPNNASPQSQPASLLCTTRSHDNNDNDGEVLFVSSHEKPRNPNVRTSVDDHHGSLAQLSATATHDAQSVDYAANLGFPQQPDAALLKSHPPSPPMMRTTMNPSNPYPFGFTPTTWVFPQHSHSYM
jgi:hypothetical protein